MIYEFRGKRIKNNEWEYGSLCEFANGDMTIASPCTNGQQGLMDMYMVDPKTVSQYIWHDDKNGKHIFEGDILKHVFGRLYLVEWYECGARYVLTCIGDERKNADFTMHCGGEFEVVGNRYDNPEMVEVQP